MKRKRLFSNESYIFVGEIFKKKNEKQRKKYVKRIGMIF